MENSEKKFISIFGLGYVGTVSSACLANFGYNIIGVDISEYKVNLLNKGDSPIVEPQLPELIYKGYREGKLSATTDTNEAILKSEISFICVGTPSEKDGSVNLDFLYNVCNEIKEAVNRKGKNHIVVIRSTVPPGTTEYCDQILNEDLLSDLKIETIFNPEFLREAQAVKDFTNPQYTIIGSEYKDGADKLSKIYEVLNAPIYIETPAIAELVKYAANTWHATKITFANEIGRIANQHKVDGKRIMELIVEDTILNISKAYMKPGFAYGGSCLPKDVNAINYISRIKNINTPLMSSLPKSNNFHIEYAFQRIVEQERKSIIIFGLTFKPGTDDLRESPSVILAEKLLGKGYNLKIIDNNIEKSKLIGSNKKYINEKIPHLFNLFISTKDIKVDNNTIIVISYIDDEFKRIINSLPPSLVIDLCGIYRGESSKHTILSTIY
ncbi:MAG: nucleotide sugar dehydrogenase [bacterium]